jgi:hypothetical protein
MRWVSGLCASPISPASASAISASTSGRRCDTMTRRTAPALRDYIHVCDIADAHVVALHHLLEGAGRAVRSTWQMKRRLLGPGSHRDRAAHLRARDRRGSGAPAPGDGSGRGCQPGSCRPWVETNVLRP